MVKIKEVKKDTKEEDSLDSEELGGSDEEMFESSDKEETGEAVDEGGIFDDDFETFDEDDVATDFDIGSTILSVSAPVESWRGQNLEEAISRERVEKDWGDEEEFAAGDFYKNSDKVGEAYQNDNRDVYSSGLNRGGGVYDESGGRPYDPKKDKDTYAIHGGKGKEMKSAEQLEDDRRGGRSILERTGFEDSDKQRRKDFNTEAVRRSGDGGM